MSSNSLDLDNAAKRGARSVFLGVLVNLILVVIKGTAGVMGNSYALIADAIESGSDVFTSLIVALGLRLSRKPPDHNHPYGHGKFEPLAAVIVALVLLGSAILIAVKSIEQIFVPHIVPAFFTLYVLTATIIAKELLFRHILSLANQVESLAVKSDAWHHRSDAITSLAAFVGILIAIIGGPGYESADDFAALIASVLIVVNAINILSPALAELLDKAPDHTISTQIRLVATNTPGVLGTHKCYIRKLGFDYFVDLDVLCDPNMTIKEGHEIAHNVGEAIHKSLPFVTKVLVHVEPVDDYGRRNRDNLGQEY